MNLHEIPEWFGASIIGAVLAALGYMSKSLIDLYRLYREIQRTRKSKLIELQSLLKASKVVFQIQNSHAINLVNFIHVNPQQESEESIKIRDSGYEETISNAYPLMEAKQKELHNIIRNMTIHGLLPINMEILEWLKRDTFFKASKRGKNNNSLLANMLGELQPHLILWIAKYEAWIPSYQEHALVYLNDEEKHGVKFPKGIDKLIDDILTKF